MISEDECFRHPQNKNISIWRYMDFAKLVSLLQTRSLFFTRANHLFEQDPYEGSLPKPNVQMRDLIPLLRNNDPQFSAIKEAYKGISDEQLTALFRNQSKTYEENIPKYFVNCWHMNEHESAAMWQLYSKSNESICIKSTFNKLHDTLPAWVYTGEINYLDYERESIQIDNDFWPIVHKRKSFQHENEIRAVAWESLCDELGGNIIRETMTNWGLSVSVELDKLIDAIYVNPSSPDWFHEAVKWIVSESKLNIRVEKSSLSNSPLY